MENKPNIMLQLQLWMPKMIYWWKWLFGRPFALCYRTVVCPVLWCWCIMVGRIKMKLGTEVGLGPGYIVLDGDQDPPPPYGHSPPTFGPCLLWPNGWMDQYATWYEGRPQPRPHCVTWGCNSPSQKGHSPQSSAHVYCGQMVAHLSYCSALVWISKGSVLTF